jgi:hypothetical protein
MNADQARRLITLHDNADRALANLRNANSMSTDDPRATELLETAGDAYAEWIKAIWGAQSALLEPSLVDVVRSTSGVESAEAPADAPSAPEKGGDASGEGQAAPSA